MFRFLYFALTGIGCIGTVGAENTPALFEAESIPAQYAKVEQDPDASGGLFIMAGNEDKYMPLVAVKVPEFERMTIWARVRERPKVLRTDLDGKAVDLKWHHRVSENWEWVNFGTYSRSELGEMIRIVRAPGGPGGIDALFLDPTESIDPAFVADMHIYETL